MSRDPQETPPPDPREPRPVVPYRRSHGLFSSFIDAEGTNSAANFWLRATAGFILNFGACALGVVLSSSSGKPALFFVPPGILIAAAVVVSFILRRRGFLAGIMLSFLGAMILALALFLLLWALCGHILK